MSASKHYEVVSTIGSIVQVSDDGTINRAKCREHWIAFNKALCSSHMQTWSGAKKYGVLYKEGNRILYYCGIELNEFKSCTSLPSDFIKRDIPGGRYKSFSVTGSLDRLGEVEEHLIKENNSCRWILLVERFDEQFKWSKAESVVTVLIPDDENA